MRGIYSQLLSYPKLASNVNFFAQIEPICCDRGRCCGMWLMNGTPCCPSSTLAAVRDKYSPTIDLPGLFINRTASASVPLSDRG
jgi:hypothetical protein